MTVNRRELIERRLACRHALTIPDLPQDIADGFKWFYRHADERLTNERDPARARFCRECAAQWHMLAASARHAESREACLQTAVAWERLVLETHGDEAAA
ncbi:MAG TPA: hypothetical protein VGM72_10960 [Micropepsaceae bacterium]